MRKIIKLKIENTNRIRTTEDTYCEIYSHDKNNGLFEFEIINEYLEVESPKAVFKFTNSNKVWQTTGTVVDGRIKVKFDTTLITIDEVVVCWLYLDEEQRSSDAYRFKFKVKLSEIDKVDGYETKERFIKDTLIVDRLDVMTREDLDRAIKDIQTGAFSKEGLLTETKAEETYAKKSEAVDNTNFELIKNRVLALELKTDKDTVYDDSEVKQRLTTLENKSTIDTSHFITDEALESKGYIKDVSNLATKEELEAVRGSQPSIDNLVTKDELASKNYLTEHQNLDEYAKKSELPQSYNDTEVKERLTTLENKAPVDLSNLATKQELNEVRNSQPTVDTSNLVTRDELTAKNYVTDEILESKGYLKSHQSLENLVTKQELEEKHFIMDQALNNYALKSELYNDTDLKARVEVLEKKTDKDTVYDDTQLKERVTALESKAIEGGAYDDSDLRNRVVALETKEDKDTKYDDTEVKHRLTELENKPAVDTSVFITEEKLNEKGYLTSHQSLENVVTKEELENKGYLRQHQDISNLATKEELAKAVTKDELASKNYVTEETLQSKNYLTEDVLNTKHYLTEHQPLDNLVTKDELENKGYLTTHQNLDNYALKSEIPAPYNDSEVKQRLGVLEAKQDKDTVYDDTPLKERVTALESKAIEGGAYDDGDLRNRVVALESKEDKDTKYDDTDLRNRVTNLENKPPLDTSEFVTNQALESKGYIKDVSNLVTKDELENKHFLTEHQNLSSLVTKQELENKGYLTSHQPLDNLVTKEELNSKGYLISHQPLTDYAKKSELYNDTEVKQRLTTLESKPAQTLTIENGNISISGGNSVALPVSRYEIHGTGMPNGVVEAEIGTTYIDKNKTNGAFKWIKTTNGGNQGWEVLIGDTGWRTLNSVSKLGNSFVKIRRVNNEVTYQFGGLSYGWFGIVRRGGAGYSAQVTDLERNCFILWSEQIPEGFRTPNSLIGSIFNDRGVAYGTWYVGNALDKNHLRFQFLNPVPTDRDIGDIRVSTISYFTNEPWPVRLP